MALHFLLLTALLGTFSQVTNGNRCQATCVDMDGQLFFFPGESSTSYVVLKPNLATPVKSFTVCMRTTSELTRKQSLFSCSNPNQDNELLMMHTATDPDPYSLRVGNDYQAFNTLENIIGRKHICGTWDSSDGIVQMWVNGKSSDRKVANKGYTIQTNDIIMILGQEQDSHGGSFDKNQSFVGEIGDVHMWNHVLSTTDIQQVMSNNRAYNGNVLSWGNLCFEMKGNVLVGPVPETSN